MAEDLTNIGKEEKIETTHNSTTLRKLLLTFWYVFP